MGGNSLCYDFNGANLDTKFTATTPGLNCALTLATSGQFLYSGEADSTFDPLLNNAPAALIGGIVLAPQASSVGRTYNYVNTRNNNFSNRAQKGAINVA